MAEASGNAVPSDSTGGVGKSPSVEKQLAEVYDLVDQLHVLTDRIKTNMAAILEDLTPESGDIPHE